MRINTVKKGNKENKHSSKTLLEIVRLKEITEAPKIS